jgi:hypothetical protein
VPHLTHRPRQSDHGIIIDNFNAEWKLKLTDWRKKTDLPQVMRRDIHFVSFDVSQCAYSHTSSGVPKCDLALRRRGESYKYIKFCDPQFDATDRDMTTHSIPESQPCVNQPQYTNPVVAASAADCQRGEKD